MEKGKKNELNLDEARILTKYDFFASARETKLSVEEKEMNCNSCLGCGCSGCQSCSGCS